MAPTRATNPRLPVVLPVYKVARPPEPTDTAPLLEITMLPPVAIPAAEAAPAFSTMPLDSDVVVLTLSVRTRLPDRVLTFTAPVAAMPAGAEGIKFAPIKSEPIDKLEAFT